MVDVLVVEDDADLRLLFEVVLGRGGITVRTVPGGPEALVELRERVPDLVVLDVQMPDMDGWETLAAIRARPEWAHVPVLLCTVEARIPDVLRGWQLGCDGYLTKPFDNDDLIREVHRVANCSADERARARELGIADAERRMSLEA